MVEPEPGEETLGEVGSVVLNGSYFASGACRIALSAEAFGGWLTVRLLRRLAPQRATWPH